jgi:hypothetical protein
VSSRGSLLKCEIEIVHADLRRHQFVEERSEDLLELRSFRPCVFDLPVCQVQCFGDLSLLLERGQRNLQRFDARQGELRLGILDCLSFDLGLAMIGC